jgi:hypothetical protein
MYPDFKELLSVLNAEGVRYLIVGGYAVSFYSEPRATKDLDLLVEPTPENADAIFPALARFGAPLEGLTRESFLEPDSFFRMDHPPYMVDLLPQIPGVDFEAALARRVCAKIDGSPSFEAPFISACDLLVAKEVAGRPQDLADAPALRAAETARDESAKASDSLRERGRDIGSDKGRDR